MQQANEQSRDPNSRPHNAASSAFTATADRLHPLQPSICLLFFHVHTSFPQAPQPLFLFLFSLFLHNSVVVSGFFTTFGKIGPVKVHQGAIGKGRRSRFFAITDPVFALLQVVFVDSRGFDFLLFLHFFPLGVFCVRRFLPSRQWDERRRKKTTGKRTRVERVQGFVPGESPHKKA